MPKKRPVKRRTQLKKADDFKSVAKRLGCDEDPEGFEAIIRKIAKAKPKKMLKPLVHR